MPLAHAWQARLPLNFLPKPMAKKFPPSLIIQAKTAYAGCPELLDSLRATCPRPSYGVHCTNIAKAMSTSGSANPPHPLHELIPIQKWCPFSMSLTELVSNSRSFSFRHYILIRYTNFRHPLGECYTLRPMITYVPSTPILLVLMIEKFFQFSSIIKAANRRNILSVN